MKRLLKILRAGLLMLLVVVAGGALLHPYLAVTAPVSSKVAVVEGWIPKERMPDVKEEILRRGYERIYTTGTLRPFSYHLRVGESLEAQLTAPAAGAVLINVSGIGNAGFLLLADGDTVLVQAVHGTPTAYHGLLVRPAKLLQVVSTNAGTPPTELDNIYVKRFLIEGANVHQLTGSVAFIRHDGARDPGWPTHAHSAAACLVALGLKAEMITIVPGLERTDSRTLANAAGFAVQAKLESVERFDVISLGVHARRSRKMYRKAMGEGAHVGVIAMPDPEVPPGSWWRQRMGRVRMLKELAGVPASSFFEAGE